MTASLHPLAQLTLVALAVSRVTVLLVDDAILELPRGRLLAKTVGHDYLTTLLTCQRCLGFWVSLAWSLAWFRWPVGSAQAAAPFAVAMLAWWAGGSWLRSEG